MPIITEITSRDFELTPPQNELIDRSIDKLQRFHPRLIACRVAVEGPVAHHRSGGPYRVRIVLTAPGAEIIVGRQKGDTIEEAVHRAFGAARRRLEDAVRVTRGFVKRHEGPPIGRVVTLVPEEDHGFLETPDGREIYFHRNSVLGKGFDGLEAGTLVRFAEEQGEKGPQASSMSIVER